ncbi:hypothetical protein IJH06_02000 [Candidatus Saccharibacteria bacterium]|nr:hypothetical protein [Candidatus Saccharibacteria bacterium]
MVSIKNGVVRNIMSDEERAETLRIAQKPYVDKWSFYFEKDAGTQNRLEVVRAFVEFLGNSKETSLSFSGHVMLGGEVYGRHGFKDGAGIFTSDLKSVRRVHGNNPLASQSMAEGKIGQVNELLQFTTSSGSDYYVHVGNWNAFMALMLGDFYHEGSLSNTEGYYVTPDIWEVYKKDLL